MRSFSVCAGGRNSWEFTSGQARHCSFGTPFSLCKCDDAICQNQCLLARHCSLLTAPSHASAEITVRFCLHIAATHLCSFAVSQWLLAASFPLELSRYLEKSICPVVFSLLRSGWFSSCLEELKPKALVIEHTKALRHGNRTQAIGPYCSMVPYRGEVMAQNQGSPNPQAGGGWKC